MLWTQRLVRQGDSNVWCFKVDSNVWLKCLSVVENSFVLFHQLPQPRFWEKRRLQPQIPKRPTSPHPVPIERQRSRPQQTVGCWRLVSSVMTLRLGTRLQRHSISKGKVTCSLCVKVIAQTQSSCQVYVILHASDGTYLNWRKIQGS